jgi:hypothetical protein
VTNPQNSEAVKYIQTNKNENSDLYTYFQLSNVKNQDNYTSIREYNNFTHLEKQNSNSDDSSNTGSIWNASDYSSVSVPPRSRLYLYQDVHYKGRVFVFENPHNHHLIFSVVLTVYEDIKSYKWIPMFPSDNQYTMNTNGLRTTFGLQKK